MMSDYVFDFKQTNKATLPLAGGKGANLGKLAKIPGIRVPDGFCVSTDAFKKAIEEATVIDGLLNRLSLLKAEDQEAIVTLSAAIRNAIESSPIPQDVSEEITKALAAFDANAAWAVRSSATAEDLPGASFAGQQDTYLNIIGQQAVLQHIRKCWASLFTDRAIAYRIQNGFDHRKVRLAVVVQLMVQPHAAGITFTAHPVSGNRKVLSIDAGFGLGEAIVSGLVSADNYQVRDGEIIDKNISAKKIGIYSVEGGGTKETGIERALQNRQVLTDEQILQLEQIGRQIEAHFGSPQDIEWCLENDTFYIVQSRPITTLFPIPETGDHEKPVYISVGHQQMMTDAMRPLGISLWQLTAARPMYKAGGRLFVDIAAQLAIPAARAALIEAMGKHDPLLKDALLTLIERGDFIESPPDDGQPQPAAKNDKPAPPPTPKTETADYPEIVAELIANSEASLAELKQTIGTKTGVELFDFILEDRQALRVGLFDPQSMAAIMASMDAAFWINDKMEEWLGDKNAADTLAQSVPNNITSEMGMALLDVADAIRPYPEVIEYLQQTKDDSFLDSLPQLDGGQQARQAIGAYLEKYGMRCSGEIDITNTRWSEKPSLLITMLLNNIKNFAPGEGAHKFAQGLAEASKKEQDLLSRLMELPDGEAKAAEAKRHIGILRNFAGYREYPKYGIMARYFVYKMALMKEAKTLVDAGLIADMEDAYYLTFQEFREVVRTKELDGELIRQRREEHQFHQKLNPPRVITSDGEIITGRYKRGGIPTDAIAGLAVSAGTVEGRARVILNMADANLEEGDILVTTFTDPSWTPLFLSIKGLVTEVGGLMTHGAVIAREYGLPAVVGAENATKLIADGQRIRVKGTEGYVEIL
jgi:phosphoenolpyruvate synthase/pyruvate phosphate dikinase